jgi:hypothetical protein
MLSFNWKDVIFLFRDSFINFISLYAWILPHQKCLILRHPKLLRTMLLSIILLFQILINWHQKDANKFSNCTSNRITFQDITPNKIWNISITKKVLSMSLMEIFKFRKASIKIPAPYYSEKVTWKVRKQKANPSAPSIEERATL